MQTLKQEHIDKLYELLPKIQERVNMKLQKEDDKNIIDEPNIVAIRPNKNKYVFIGMTEVYSKANEDTLETLIFIFKPLSLLSKWSESSIYSPVTGLYTLATCSYLATSMPQKILVIKKRPPF